MKKKGIVKINTNRKKVGSQILPILGNQTDISNFSLVILKRNKHVIEKNITLAKLCSYGNLQSVDTC